MKTDKEGSQSGDQGACGSPAAREKTELPQQLSSGLGSEPPLNVIECEGRLETEAPCRPLFII